MNKNQQQNVYILNSYTTFIRILALYDTRVAHKFVSFFLSVACVFVLFYFFLHIIFSVTNFFFFVRRLDFGVRCSSAVCFVALVSYLRCIFLENTDLSKLRRGRLWLFLFDCACNDLICFISFKNFNLRMIRMNELTKINKMKQRIPTFSIDKNNYNGDDDDDSCWTTILSSSNWITTTTYKSSF